MAGRYVQLVAAAFLSVAGCGGDRCAHDICDPGSEFDAVVAVPDTVAGGDAADAAGADAARDGAVTDADDNGDDAGNDVGSDVLPPYEWGCKVCTLDADCGQGAACVPVGAQKHCINECRDDGDCAKGFVCIEGTAPRKACLPVSFNCVACAFDEPCDAGKCCDFNSGSCKDCGTECSQCTYDYECGDGFRCFIGEGEDFGFCVPECVDGACDTPFLECVKNARGVEMCQPTSDGCGGCTTPTPWPMDGGCVGCRDRMDCGEGEACLDATHECAPVECQVWGDVPCGDGQCHQCCEDSDCDWRYNSSGVCLEGGTCEPEPDCQGLCTYDFPVCALVNGVEQCVQCVDDDDCLALGWGPDCTCGGAPQFTCFDPYGSLCGGDPACTSSCSDSGDCPPGPEDTVLDCVHEPDHLYGVCVDPSGHCDGGLTNCCGGAQQCYDLVQVLQEIYPTVPRIIPQPDVTLTYCGCDTADDCLTGDPCTELSILCTSGDFGMEGMYELICPDGQLHEAFPDRLCVQPATLLEYFGLVPAT